MSHLERLTTRIIHPHDPTPSTEDIFCSALETLFTDDTHQSHGVPGRSIIYRSPRFGDVYLLIPSHPDEEGGRLLFAHYLWNAAVIAAEAIERASCDEDEDVDGKSTEVGSDTEVGTSNDSSDQLVKWDKRSWDMRGMDVLELGAATALPSLISTLSNAQTVTSTDHPSSPAITMNAISQNFQINITNRNSPFNPTSHHQQKQQTYTNDTIPDLRHPPIPSITTRISIHGYTWGTTAFFSPDRFGQPSTSQPAPASFDRIIIADCLWMPAQHENLAKSVLTYLKNNDVEEKGAGKVACALVIAGFHTGRGVVRDFVRIATGSDTGDGGGGEDTEGQKEEKEAGDEQVRGKLRAAEIFEVDVDGRRRPWEPERPSETKEQSKRWCMCAVLVRR